MHVEQSVGGAGIPSEPRGQPPRALSITEYSPPPPPVQPVQRAKARRPVGRSALRLVRPIVGLAVLVVHGLLGWLLLQPIRTMIRVNKPVVPLTVFVIAKTAVAPITTDIAVEPVNTGEMSAGPPPTLVALQAQEAPHVTAQSHGITIPPRPLEPLPDSRAFAEQAGLSPGVGITVVLRIEVRGDGTIDQVQIDVSGGSHLIDQAAIAYVHAVKWVGGRINDKPESIWIRWGVTLSA